MFPVSGKYRMPIALKQKTCGLHRNLHLTDDQEDALVAFLKTLTDGYVATAP
jgi:hypothetical protein